MLLSLLLHSVADVIIFNCASMTIKIFWLYHPKKAPKFQPHITGANYDPIVITYIYGWKPYIGIWNYPFFVSMLIFLRLFLHIYVHICVNDDNIHVILLGSSSLNLRITLRMSSLDYQFFSCCILNWFFLSFVYFPLWWP